MADFSQIEQWIDDSELATINSSTFWNDEEKEKAKPYYITDGNAEKLWRYLRETTTLNAQYEAGVATASQLGVPLRGIGVDVAAGVCWTTSFLSRVAAVERVYALEISKHRLLHLAPNVCAALSADTSKITRVLGSFYDIRLPEASVDFVLMSQAFHHADEPGRLLEELRRILKPGSPVLLVGEQPIYPREVVMKRLKNAAKMVLPRRLYASPPVYALAPTFRQLFPADVETGDHYYRIGDYDRMFQDAGFALHVSRTDQQTVFVALRSGRR